MQHLIATCREKGHVNFWVKVRPNAHRNAIAGALDDGTLKIDLAAPPEKGKANRELISLIAEEFEVPKSSVEILCGEGARQKQVRVLWP